MISACYLLFSKASSANPYGLFQLLFDDFFPQWDHCQFFFFYIKTTSQNFNRRASERNPRLSGPLLFAPNWPLTYPDWTASISSTKDLSWIWRPQFNKGTGTSQTRHRFLIYDSESDIVQAGFTKAFLQTFVNSSKYAYVLARPCVDKNSGLCEAQNQIPCSGVLCSYDPPKWECWGPNSCLLEEQQMLFTTDPSSRQLPEGNFF